MSKVPASHDEELAFLLFIHDYRDEMWTVGSAPPPVSRTCVGKIPLGYAQDMLLTAPQKCPKTRSLPLALVGISSLVPRLVARGYPGRLIAVVLR